MASGEHGHGAVAVPDPKDLPVGAVVTASGRVSAAEFYEEPPADEHPFTPVQLSRLDEALTLTTRDTGLRFSLYIGDLGGDSKRRAVGLHEALPESDSAVLVAVSPGERKVEVVTGADARLRLPDRAAKLAVLTMVISFKEDDLFGGLLSGLRKLAEQAGRQR